MMTCRLFKSCIFIFACILCIFAQRGTPVDEPDTGYVYMYTAKDFKEHIEEMDGNFIMFYAPWCSHCKVFQPSWNELADMVNSESSTYAIAQVDCTKEHKLCNEYDITGYPTLLYFYKNNFSPVEYRGTRDLGSLTTFLSEVYATDTESRLAKKDPRHITIYHGMASLTEANFDKFVSVGQHFIMFYMPWCGESQKIAPIWAELASIFANNDTVQIGKLNCMEHEATCSNFEIKDFPFLAWMVNGKLVQAITGYNTLEALKDFIDKMAKPENHNPEKYIKKHKSFPVVRITEHTFNTYLQSDYLFVNFFATWCAHCKLMVPPWVQLGEWYQNDNRIVIADVDCSLSEALCNEEGIDQFPVFRLYHKQNVLFEMGGSNSFENLRQIVETAFKTTGANTEPTIDDVGTTQYKDEL